MSYKVALIEFGTPEYDETVTLRTEILRKPLGLTFSEDQLSEEYKDFHLALYNHADELLACLILSPMDDKKIKMRQVAVAEQLQGRGIGKILVNYSEEFCKFRNYKQIVLNARDTAVAFYESLQYCKDEKPFIEVGIPHHYMWKNI